MKSTYLYLIFFFTVSFSGFATNKEEKSKIFNLTIISYKNEVSVTTENHINCFEVATAAANAYMAVMKKYDITPQPCEYQEVFGAAHVNCTNRLQGIN